MMTKQEVLRALADGKQLQGFRFNEELGSGGYHSLSEAEVFELILAGELNESAMRLAPQPVPFTEADYPPVFWVRLRAEHDHGFALPGNPKLALGFNAENGVYYAGGGNDPFSSEVMAERYEISTDRKTWVRPVKEVAK